MSKRRRASELIFKTGRAFKYPVKVVGYTSGTGTEPTIGVISVIAAAATTNRAYITLTSGTNIGTIVGTNVGSV